MKDKNVVKNIKKHLRWGDFGRIVKRIYEKYGVEFSRSAVASTLNPNSEYCNDVIYAEALLLAKERKSEIEDISSLEMEFND